MTIDPKEMTTGEAEAFRLGAMAMREKAAALVEGVTRPEDWFMAPVAARIRALAPTTPGEGNA